VNFADPVKNVTASAVIALPRSSSVTAAQIGAFQFPAFATRLNAASSWLRGTKQPIECAITMSLRVSIVLPFC
jgi:hypothetical protein